jgi:AcrR family transcriptional regulator
VAPAGNTGEETKERMVSAARDLLLQGGLPGLSMRAVAHECGVSATAIYRHFEDKDHLLSAAVLQGFRLFACYLQTAFKECEPGARLVTLMRRYFDFACENRNDYRLIFMTDCEQQSLPRLDEASRREIRATFQMLQDCITESQRAGLVMAGDPRSLAAYAWSSLHGLASLIVGGNLGASEDEIVLLIDQHLVLLSRSLKC